MPISPRKAVVIGGSVGGLFAANLLLRRGWQVDIIERVSESLESRGTGIARHVELEAIIAAAGVRDHGPVGMKVDGRVAYDRYGTIIGRYTYLQELGAWSRVYRPLYDAFPSEHYHRGRELIGIEQRAEHVVARLADGASFEADLLVGADGFKSAVRALVAPDIQPVYSGYVAWRGLLDEAGLSAEFRADTFLNYSFLFPQGSQFIGYPMGGADNSIEIGRRRYAYLWYVPVDAERLQDLLTDEQGRRHNHSIPPPLLRREHIDGLREQARAALPPRFGEVVEKAVHHMMQPIYDVESREIAFGRIALLGDAAFVARPHVGVGVLKAAQDALALANCLDGAEVVPALRNYAAERISVGRETVAFGRHLGAFIERRLPNPMADPSLDLTPQKIIRVSGRPVVHGQELSA